MAPTPKFISFLFLILTLFFMQIHASRQPQSFSKVSATTVTITPAAVTTAKNQNNAKEATLPNKEESFQEQEPSFIPETQNNAYGLYGQEPNQVPTTTKLSSAPFTTTAKFPEKAETLTQNHPETYTTYPNKYYNNNQYNNNAFEEQQQNQIGETSLQESGYTTTATNQNNNNYNNVEKLGMSDTRTLENGRYYYDLHNENTYHPKQQESLGQTQTSLHGYTTTAANHYNNYNNGEKQGMSDTRTLENGRYYYDIKNENNYYNPNQYQNSRNSYDARGYSSNNEHYENNNSMENYQNQEFQESQEEEQYEP